MEFTILFDSCLIPDLTMQTHAGEELTASSLYTSIASDLLLTRSHKYPQGLRQKANVYNIPPNQKLTLITVKAPAMLSPGLIACAVKCHFVIIFHCVARSDGQINIVASEAKTATVADWLA